MILNTLGRFRLHIPGVRGLITLENILLLSGFKSGDSLFFYGFETFKDWFTPYQFGIWFFQFVWIFFFNWFDFSQSYPENIQKKFPGHGTLLFAKASLKQVYRAQLTLNRFNILKV